MRAKRWVIASPDTERVRVLSRETGYTPLTAAVLSARGIDTPQAAADYLSCDARGLHDPFGLTDMDKAVEVVREVIDRGEKMVVYGDYDVDGITATCTLVDYLRSKGAKCEYYIPNRLTDGYGLTRPAMEQLYEQGTRLLITVDSGITANEEIAVARELGMQVVITDHHECHENLPDAQAVVDCKRTDDTYPFSSLAGVGVAFKLICALEGDTLSMLDRYADLVALGTVADVMPIVGENRIIVAEGLKKLAPHKSRRTILAPMRQIQTMRQENQYDLTVYRRSSRFVPAGQSTQMIIGATGESDYTLLQTTQQLYQGFDLKRVFYSAYIPLNEDDALPGLGTPTPLLREHRLYQADWLLRFYGFQADELLSEEKPDFNELIDPKCDWALRHLEQFPVEVETASYARLLRVPGIGPKSASRITYARRYGRLDFASLKKMGVVLKRAHYFITCGGKQMYHTPIEASYITRQLVSVDKKDVREI